MSGKYLAMMIVVLASGPGRGGMSLYIPCVYFILLHAHDYFDDNDNCHDHIELINCRFWSEMLGWSLLRESQQNETYGMFHS